MAENPQRIKTLIGVQPQSPAFQEKTKLTEIIELFAAAYGEKVNAKEFLDDVNLNEKAGNYVEQLSGGQKQRLSIAAALVHSPKVFFMDEPTTGLDPMSRMSLWEEVRRLNNEGTTVMLTTQYLEEADQLADRIAIIDAGKIVREGKPQDIKAGVGFPTLLITVPADQSARAKAVLATFGDMRPTAEGSLGVGLRGGANVVTDVVRNLDDASVRVQHLEINEPSLAAVFAAATGHRLEGAKA